MKETKKKKTDHIQMSMLWPGTLMCYHCGETYELKLPMPLSFSGRVMKAWCTEHRRCPKSDRGELLRLQHKEANDKFEEEKKKNEMQSKLLPAEATDLADPLPGALDDGAVGAAKAHQQAPEA